MINFFFFLFPKETSLPSTKNKECLIELINQYEKLQPILKLGASKVSVLIPKNHNGTITKLTSNQPIFLKSAKINKIRINSILHTTIQKLQQDVQKLKQRIEQIKTDRLIRIKRQSVSIDKQIKKLIVNNLITDSDFFNGKSLI